MLYVVFFQFSPIHPEQENNNFFKEWKADRRVSHDEHVMSTTYQLGYGMSMLLFKILFLLHDCPLLGILEA